LENAEDFGGSSHFVGRWTIGEWVREKRIAARFLLNKFSVIHSESGINQSWIYFL
jgi:hypothetical protein